MKALLAILAFPLVVHAYDDRGGIVAQAPMWAATPFDIAHIDSTGSLMAIHPGEVLVFAIVGGRRPGFWVAKVVQPQVP